MKNDRPWSNEKKPLETPHVSETLYWSKELKEEKLFIADYYTDFHRLTLGLATSAVSMGLLLTVCYVMPSAKPQKLIDAITEPLHAGENVLIASEAHTSLLSEIFEAWVEFAKFPENFTSISMSGFILDSEDLRGEPGVLLGLHPTQPIGPLGYLIARIPEEEAPILEFLGQSAIINIKVIE